MRFHSVFGGDHDISFRDALLNGFASDGSMLVPDSIPSLDVAELTHLSSLSFPALMQRTLARFIDADTVSFDELGAICTRAFASFDLSTADREPIRMSDVDSIAVLELFHGPSKAFKDFGMQVIAELMEFILEKSNSAPRSLVVATSGDTGAAALAAFVNRRKASITVLFPKGKVAPTQARQMTAISAPNAAVFAVSNSSSDMLDTILARLFTEKQFAERVSLGSVNSVNVVRILCQTVHFFWAYFTTCRMRGFAIGERIHMALPSGALGNAVSALVAQRTGLPIDVVVCNTAANNVTSEFVRSGEFHVRAAVTTIAPAIDIGDPYNIQRVFYYLTNGDTKSVREWMSQWTSGHFKLDEAHRDGFRRMFRVTEASEAEMADAMRTVHQKHKYVLDPHTVVAWVGAEKLVRDGVDRKHICVVATASPLKFLSTVQQCIPDAHLEPDAKLAALDDVDHSIAADHADAEKCFAAVRDTVEQLSQRLRKTDILP